jgi:hypothetical protein
MMDNKRNNFEDVRDPEVLRSYLLRVAADKLFHAAGKKYADVVRVRLEKKDWAVYDGWQSQKIIRH